MKNVFAVCLFSAAFLFLSQNVFACICSENFAPLIADYSKAETVFVGKVISIKKFGKESEKKAYYPKYRTVEFEIQKIYKGMNSPSETVTLHTNFSEATCGFSKDEAPKKGQKWIVFAYKDQKENRLHFGGMCKPSSKLESADDLSEYETKFLSIKDKQGIFGSLINEMKFDGIKNIEVHLEGEGMKLTTRTDDKGLFYFPISSKGIYKITFNVLRAAYFTDSNSAVDQKLTIENANGDSKIVKTVLTYQVQLKENEFDYNEIKLYVYE